MSRPPRAPLPAAAVRDFHGGRAAITEDLLAPAVSAHGTTPYQWLALALPTAPHVLDLACGSAPMSDASTRYTGVDASATELAEARRRRPGVDVRLGDALDPELTSDLGQVDAVVVSMALMLLPFERVLERCAQHLPRRGVLAGIVPLRGDAVRGTTYGEVLASLGELDRPYPEPLDEVGARAGGLGWQLLDDAREGFLRQPDPSLLLASFYAPDATADGRAAATALLEEPLDYPLRRLVLRRR